MLYAKKVAASLLAVLIAFAFACVLDPNSAILNNPNSIRRAAMFIAYLGSFHVTWLLYRPRRT